jgi:hypothetical protein
MKRLLGIGAVALLAGCGSGHANHATGSFVVDYSPHVPRSSVTPIANRREHRAEREAQSLLNRIPLPAGAVRLRSALAPTDPLTHSELGVSTISMTADRYFVWTVPESGRAVLAFERRHVIPGLKEVGGGSGPGGWGSDEFDGRHPVGRPIGREVSMSVEPHGNGVLLRIDAGISWIYPRAATEVVPAGVREVDVHDGKLARRVTKPAEVAKIVRWFDGLNVMQPGPSVGCMAVIASRVQLTFRSATGARLARAVASSGAADNCTPIRFTVGGKEQTPLIDVTFSKNAFAGRLARLLGVKFPTR